jgi:hypothetical protein
MRKIIIGIVFIIGGTSGYLVLRGTNSSIALGIVGAVILVWGILETFLQTEQNEEEQKESDRFWLCKVVSDKLIVYAKTHESLGVIEEVSMGQQVIVDFGSDYGRFYKAFLGGRKQGYILKDSNLEKIQSINK